MTQGSGGGRAAPRDPVDTLVTAARVHAALSASGLGIVAAAAVFRLLGWSVVWDERAVVLLMSGVGGLVALADTVVAYLLGREWRAANMDSGTSLERMQRAFRSRGLPAMALAVASIVLTAILIVLGAGWALILIALAGVIVLQALRPNVSKIETLMRRELQSGP